MSFRSDVRSRSVALSALAVLALSAPATIGLSSASADPGDSPSLCSPSGQGSAGLPTPHGRGGDLRYRTADGVVSDAGAVALAGPGCPPAGSAATPVATGATTGRTLGSNPGAPGQCTWGAAQKWFEGSGSYPAVSGNALSWGDSAAAAGWTVVNEARDRSIVVFQPGVAGAGPIGHVAWVDSVAQRADGRYLHVTEMNNTYYGGPGIFNGRDVKEVPGMSYILLP